MSRINNKKTKKILNSANIPEWIVAKMFSKFKFSKAPRDFYFYLQNTYV